MTAPMPVTTARRDGSSSGKEGYLAKGGHARIVRIVSRLLGRERWPTGCPAAAAQLGVRMLASCAFRGHRGRIDHQPPPERPTSAPISTVALTWRARGGS